jgi:hypothetical protein
MATDTAPGDTGEANATGGSGYKTLADFRDELFDQSGRPRPCAASLIESLEQLGRAGRDDGRGGALA